MSTHPPAASPLSVSLELDPPTCSLSGTPPFTITIAYTCTMLRPIWVLLSLFSEGGYHIVVRDPSRGNGRIAVRGTLMCDYDPPEPHEDAQLVRLEPKEQFRIPYTFAVEPKLGGLKHSNTWLMRDGGSYWAEHGLRQCWWMYVDDVEEDLAEGKMREMLFTKGKAEKWKPEGRVEFMAVA